MARLADLSEPELSPDGESLIYTVAVANTAEDLTQSDLWRVGFDGQHRVQLTRTPSESEWRPQWSPDGTKIAFLADTSTPGKKDEEAVAQVWLMPARGGKPRRLTAFASGVDDYIWAPDGRQLAVIVRDPEFAGADAKPKNPLPVVTERYQFKEDGVGYLDHRRTHLYLLDIASGRSERLTSGQHDELLPAWSPDGKLIAYVSKRGEDPDRHLNFDIYVIEPRVGASERQLTTFAGADLDPYWETRPAWSPDSKRIAYLTGGEDKRIYYAPWQLAVINVETGQSSVPAPIDRCFSKPRWSPDGGSIYALIEQSRVTRLSRVDLRDGKVSEVTSGNRFDYDLSVARTGRVVVLGGGDLHPYVLSAVDPVNAQETATLRTLADHNEFLAGVRLAPVEPFQFEGDGGPIEGMLVKPLDYVPGKRYPTIVRVHGGPVYQFSHEFMVDWQLYAANGYAALAINPRGSSGRGFDFSRSALPIQGASASADGATGRS